MLAANYAGERTITVEEQEPSGLRAGGGAHRGGLRRHLRHRPPRVPRRHGCAGDACRRRSGTKCPGTIARDRRRRRGVGGRRRRDRHAAGVGRHLPGLSRRQRAHLPEPRLHRHRQPRAPCRSTGTSRRRRLVRLPAGVSLRDAALVEPVAVAVHDVRRSELGARRQSRRHRRRTDRRADRDGRYGVRRRRRRSPRSIRPAVPPPSEMGLARSTRPPSTRSRGSRTGRAAPVPTWSSRCPALRPPSSVRPRSRRSAARSSSSRSTRSRGPSTCTASSGVS